MTRYRIQCASKFINTTASFIHKSYRDYRGCKRKTKCKMLTGQHQQKVLQLKVDESLTDLNCNKI